MKADWLQSNTFHFSDFSDLDKLAKIKKQKNLSISLCFPTLNEEKTIAKEIVIMRSELMQKHKILDEIVVIDSGSTDNTLTIAEKYGACVYSAKDILPNLDQNIRGKGENLWKTLFVTKGDIIVYIDADIKNIHHRFAYGLIGPLLLKENVKYVKAFYDRPIAVDKEKMQPTGGGRVTELVIRPLFSLLFPDLTQIIQPLSGEYAGYREIFENVAFPIGYGIETSILLDIYEKWGMDIIAQVDLDKRVHRNQDTLALGRMAFGVMQTFFKRLENQGNLSIKTKMFEEMFQYQFIDNHYKPKVYKIEDLERPPMITIPEYQKKFGRGDEGSTSPLSS